MKLDFCPNCGSALTAQNSTLYTCVNGHEYFNNPRAAVVVVLINEQGELLFAKRARAPHKGKYDFPGGFVDFGETADEAVRRELQEELNIQAQNLELVTTVSNHYTSLTATIDCVYICHEWSGDLQPADDVASVEWHPLSFLDSPAFAWPDGYRGLSKILRAYLQS